MENIVGANIATNRKNMNMTQRQLAEQLGITQPSYIRYDNGSSEPNIDTLIKIADMFDVSVDYLIGRTE